MEDTAHGRTPAAPCRSLARRRPASLSVWPC